jgi:hypothetical protein
MKKYIFTESQIKKVIDGVINEQVVKTDKFSFAFDNDTTNLEGVIKNDKFLYASTETPNTYKIGPIAQVPFVGQCAVDIIKKNGVATIMVYNTKGQGGKLQLVPNFTVTKM